MCQSVKRFIFEAMLRIMLKWYKEKFKKKHQLLVLPADSCRWNSRAVHWTGFVHIQSLESLRRMADNLHIPLKLIGTIHPWSSNENHCTQQLQKQCYYLWIHWIVLCSRSSYRASHAGRHETSLCCCRRTETGGWSRCPGLLAAGTWAGGQWSLGVTGLENGRHQPLLRQG